MAQITHRKDADIGYMIQIVTPAELRRILDADGENYSRPAGFDPDDEWDCEENAIHRPGCSCGSPECPEWQAAQ